MTLPATVIPVTIPETTLEIKPDAITAAVQSAYDTLDQLHLSPLVLICIAVVLTITLFFCVRELLAWFFKINGLKKDLRKTHKDILTLQTEVRRLQQISIEMGLSKLTPPASTLAPLPPPTAPSSKTESSKKPQFPINH